MSLERYAAIDIGTVTCRMLVADVDEAGIHELDREYAITNLGEGVDATGVLKPQAMERVAHAVDGYLRVLESYGVPDLASTALPHSAGGAGGAGGCAEGGEATCDAEEEGVAEDVPHSAVLRSMVGDAEGGTADEDIPIHVIAMATSASRDAKNAAEFVGMLAQRGIRLSVIPGEREAALSFLGASSDFAGENIVVVDIGGGSTEVVAGRAGREPLYAHSFNIGCRRVTERFFTADPPSAGEMAKARAWVRAEMTPFFEEMRQGCAAFPGDIEVVDGLVSACGGGGAAASCAGAVDAGAPAAFSLDRLVAVAGTATSVVSVRDCMEVYDSSRVHKAVVDRATLDEVCERLAALPLEERKRVVGLDPGRAPVIVAGLIILQEICSLAGVGSFTVSESDILHGIILDAAHGRS